MDLPGCRHTSLIAAAFCVIALAAPAPRAFGADACCLPDGSCQELSFVDCQASGGESNPWYDCESVQCHFGACCFGDGQCVDMAKRDCHLQGGHFQGDGTVCGISSCPAACALDTGACDMMSRGECDQASGTYQGYGIDCVQTATATGACCTTDGACVDATRYDCEINGGVYLGTGSMCRTTVCQAQEVLISRELGASGGDPVIIELAEVFEGAGELEQISVAVRHLIAGEFTVENRSGSDNSGMIVLNVLAELELNDNVLDFVLDETIDFDGLVPEIAPVGGGDDYIDFGTRLSRDWAVIIWDDPEILQGFAGGGAITAAYSSSGSIGTTSNWPIEFRARNMSGTVLVMIAYEYTAVTVGACCLGDAQCVEMSAADCSASGGIYVGDGATCPSSECEDDVDPLGACCLADSSCAMMTALDCTASDGSYAGDDVTCADAKCDVDDDPFGACCICPGEFCDTVRRSECQAMGGAFSEGAECSDPTYECKFMGSCCFGADLEVCIDDVSRSECESYAGAEFRPCEPCAGACLMAEAGCAQLTQSDCESRGWRFQGDCVSCDLDATGQPALGACCLDDGTCLRVSRTQCDTLGGSFQGDGVMCWDVECSAVSEGTELGACCASSGNCRDLTEADCLETGGVWDADARCADEPCGALASDGGDSEQDAFLRILEVLSNWGPCEPGPVCPGDHDRDESVGYLDLLIAMNG